MTKHILRLVVTIVILGVVGLCLWLFVFKPSESETAFSILEGIEEYKDQISYNEKLDTITSYNNTDCYTNETLLERERIFGGTTRNVDGAKSFYNEYYYQKVTKSLDKIYDIYSSYVLLAENVSKKQLKQVQQDAKEYKSALSAVTDKADRVIEYEKICVRASSSEKNGLKSELSNRYTALKDAYKGAFQSYYKLIVHLRTIVQDRTFNGEFVYDAHTSYLDIMLLFDSNLIGVPTDAAEEIKNDNVNKIILTKEQTAMKKACIIADNYGVRGAKGNLAWVDAVGETEVSDFLNAYVEISLKFQEQLKLVADYRFNFQAINALGTSDIDVGEEGYKASSVDSSSVASIKTVLKFCGIIE